LRWRTALFRSLGCDPFHNNEPTDIRHSARTKRFLSRRLCEQPRRASDRDGKWLQQEWGTKGFGRGQFLNPTACIHRPANRRPWWLTVKIRAFNSSTLAIQTADDRRQGRSTTGRIFALTAEADGFLPGNRRAAYYTEHTGSQARPRRNMGYLPIGFGKPGDPCLSGSLLSRSVPRWLDYVLRHEPTAGESLRPVKPDPKAQITQLKYINASPGRKYLRFSWRPHRIPAQANVRVQSYGTITLPAVIAYGMAFPRSRRKHAYKPLFREARTDGSKRCVARGERPQVLGPAPCNTHNRSSSPCPSQM